MVHLEPTYTLTPDNWDISRPFTLGAAKSNHGLLAYFPHRYSFILGGEGQACDESFAQKNSSCLSGF